MRDKTKPIVIQNEKKKKNMQKKLKKWWSKSFIYFMFFSKSVFEQQKKVFPLFLRNGWTDRAEIFFTCTSAKSGCVFFFLLRNVVPIKFGSLCKTRSIEKKEFLTGFSVFCLSWPIYLVFFKKKKNTHPDLVLVTTKKFSARKNEVSIFARGKTFGHFRPLWPPKPPEGGIWQFWVYDNFCSTHRDLSALRIS